MPYMLTKCGSRNYFSKFSIFSGNFNGVGHQNQSWKNMIPNGSSFIGNVITMSHVLKNVRFSAAIHYISDMIQNKVRNF